MKEIERNNPFKASDAFQSVVIECWAKSLTHKETGQQLTEADIVYHPSHIEMYWYMLDDFYYECFRSEGKFNEVVV